LSGAVRVAAEVAEALAAGRAVVALETSIVAQGLPEPQNLEAATACEAAIRAAGAVPATVAVLAGEVRVGLSRGELEALAHSRDAVKVSARDLGSAIARGQTGATTVAATVRASRLAGVRFMATGGIGGVHRGRPEDVSADLDEIARSPVAVFCAGAKLVLDLPLTLERLETLGVPVLGFGTDEFPAFYTRHSGLRVSGRVDAAVDAARAVEATWATGSQGIVVAVPPPQELADAETLVARAVADTAGIEGPALTPAILARIAELSAGRSVEVNVELVVNNARVAAEAAVAWAGLART
jgi:pseudouridine-5'-phosphate glycosidase